MTLGFLDYYRCPESFVNFQTAGRGANAASMLHDLSEGVTIKDGTCHLPFDPTMAAIQLRYEQYVEKPKKQVVKGMIRKAYYAFRPLLPVDVRRHLQKAWLSGWEKTPFPRWPVDRSVDQMFEALMRFTLTASDSKRIPFVWFWPEGKSSCAIMTHDVETQAGLDFCGALMDINDAHGIKSSFQLIPDARYVVNDTDLLEMKSRAFEVNVHDLKHDGHLFDEYELFQDSASRINEFGARFGSKGFRAAVLYRNQAWFDALKFSYDMSVPNVAHLDPQRGGCCTVMPYFVGDLLEIPVTATQDYTLFHILQTYSLDLWREQIALIMEQHGLISFIVHPDYLDSTNAVNTYRSLLKHLDQLRQSSNLWIALPGEVDTWWRSRNKMRVVPDGKDWRVEGDEEGRARVAFATMKDDKVCYEIA